MSKNQKAAEINLFSPLGITISLLITVPIFTIIIFSLYFPETWNATILKLGLAHESSSSNSAIITQQHQTSTASSPTKAVELMEQLDTPVGQLLVVKYTNDSCLYAKATTAHAAQYGTDNLKNQLKERYKVTCVLWD